MGRTEISIYRIIREEILNHRIGLVLVILVIFASIFNSLCFAVEYHWDRKNATAIKLGAQFYRSSDLTDFWGISSNSLVAPVLELEYERRITNFLFIDATLGYSNANADANPIQLANTTVGFDITSIYLSPTFKVQIPLDHSVAVYGGIGPDIYFTDSDIDITINGAGTKVTESVWSLGGHLLIGLEWLFYKKPARDNRLDAPLGLIFEYKFATVPINDFDQKAIETVNNALGTNYSPHDFDAGGHFLTVGLRWHF